MSRPAVEPNGRFDQKYRVDPNTGCFIWTGRVQNVGYPCFDPYGKPVLAHRWAYERKFGPIPEGLTLDHLCRTPRCVNPMHLEAVTHQENCLRGISPAAHNHRKTHCMHGHPFSLENTYVHGTRGTRRCRICTIESNRRSSGQPSGQDIRHRKFRGQSGACRHGHVLSAASNYTAPDGYDRCKACRKAASARWIAKSKAVSLGGVL